VRAASRAQLGAVERALARRRVEHERADRRVLDELAKHGLQFRSVEGVQAFQAAVERSNRANAESVVRLYEATREG